MSSVGHTPSFRWKPGGPSLRSEVLVQPRMSFRKVPDFGSSECAAAAHECASESLAAALISTLQLKVQVVQTYHFRTVPPFARNNFLASEASIDAKRRVGLGTSGAISTL